MSEESTASEPPNWAVIEIGGQGRPDRFVIFEMRTADGGAAALELRASPAAAVELCWNWMRERGLPASLHRDWLTIVRMSRPEAATINKALREKRPVSCRSM